LPLDSSDTECYLRSLPGGDKLIICCK